jgi:ABC-type transporter Mla MlaB component
MDCVIIDDNCKIVVVTDLTFTTVLALWQWGNKFLVASAGQPRALKTCDLQAVVNVDSSGLALLIEWQRLAARHLQFINIPLSLQLMADIAGVSELLMPQY